MSLQETSSDPSPEQLHRLATHLEMARLIVCTEEPLKTRLINCFEEIRGFHFRWLEEMVVVLQRKNQAIDQLIAERDHLMAILAARN